MKAYQKERLENLICFFAKEHYKKTKKYPSQTHIYKYLAFFEFRILERTGEAPLDLNFRAMQWGPVPEELYNNRNKIESNLFIFEKQKDNNIIVKALSMPDLDYFSEDEIKEMNSLIFMFAQKWVTSNIMSDSSHQAIKAWKKAWKRNPNSLIDKADTFDGLRLKDEEQLSPEEEHFLVSSALKQLGV